jgi:hypothetical protein
MLLNLNPALRVENLFGSGKASNIRRAQDQS